MKILVSQIVPNKFRDMTKYPIDRAKVDALKESISQTSFWDNLLARPQDNVIDPALLGGQSVTSYLESLKAAYTEEGPLFPVELSYGHHRWQAVVELGIEVIDIPVKEIEDKTQLKIMANENRGDWSANMGVILETVRQARQFLLDSVNEYPTYDEYAAAGNGFFSKEQFVQIPAQGVGFKSVQKFLGETWSERDVRMAVATLKDLDAGIYEQEQVLAFPSLSVLGGFSKLTGAINSQPWPNYFKTRMITQIAEMISDPKVSTTVKILTSATNAASEGKDPVAIIRAPGQKRKDFDVVKAVKDLCYENMDPNTKIELADIKEIEGFKDFPGIDELIINVEKSIARSETAKKAAATGQVPAAEAAEATSTEGVTGDTPSAEGLEALEAMVSSAEQQVAENGVATTPATADTLGAVPADDAAVSMDVAGTFVSASVSMISAAAALSKGLADGTVDDGDSTLMVALEDVVRAAVTVYVTCFGENDLNTLVKDILNPTSAE